MARLLLALAYAGCAVAWVPGQPGVQRDPQRLITTSAPDAALRGPVARSRLDDSPAIEKIKRQAAPRSRVEDSTESPSWGTFFLSAALGFLVAIGTSAPAFAKYKDKVDKSKLVAANSWNYEDPAAWRSISPICVAGASQSPVDITNDKLFDSAKDNLAKVVQYTPVQAEVFNSNSMTLNVQGNFGSMQLPDGEYQAKQFHFHFPAEHTVDGKKHDGELHIVHFRNNSGNYTGVSIAVVAVFLDLVPEAPAIDNLLAKLSFLKGSAFMMPAMAFPFVDGQDEVGVLKAVGLDSAIPASGKTVPLESKIDLNAFRKELEGKFYHYKGSLTTPPCTESVHWYVAEKPAPVTRAMLDQWEKAFPKSTARPVQKINKRKVVASGLSVPGEFSPAPNSAPAAPKQSPAASAPAAPAAPAASAAAPAAPATAAASVRAALAASI
eukprot:gb/GFBE01002375.1/.p1 GENE.gb/GFBE01002375.1/~~gb/GFBE01002375.1/.p1  ORF type:complete len:438 (+),score=78.92 gb/GFBE01002375.1/:1-1314(+)